MNITEDIRYIGVNDTDIDLFEGQYKVPNGMAYNSYVILDEKVAVFDTVDASKTDEWLEKLSATLDGRKVDYLIVQHMEPDHSASLMHFAKCYPDAVIVGNKKTFIMTEAFFGTDFASRRLVVEDGATLSLGKHQLTFVFAPMVHWPEVMVTYDSTDKVLFSADAFGKFGTFDCDEPWEGEARRYYIGIVGKYGVQVKALLKKADALKIETICPLHGPVLDSDIEHYIKLYNKWASYEPENADDILIAYTSVYGHTKEAVDILSSLLKEKGRNVTVHDLARTDKSIAVADAFRCGKLVLATTTYNGDIFPFMHEFITGLTERSIQNRTIGLIENGSWAPLAAKLMKGMLEKSKNITWLDATVTIRSALDSASKEQIEAMAEQL
ncbi:MAG: FprA family A-type flavoprotein [Clostridia bacterium]|nr:FprA family A-type flavoprotein [Clostridia bacterium]